MDQAEGEYLDSSSSKGSSKTVVAKHGFVRYLLSILCMIGIANMYGMRTVLSVSLVSMTTASSNASQAAIPWSNMQQGVVLSAFYWGYTIFMIPGGMFTSVYSAKHCLAFGTLTTVVLSIASPFVVENGGFVPFVTLRFFVGLFESVTFSAMFSLVSAWAPELEKTKLLTLACSGQYFGLVLSFFASGWLISHFDWKMPFYVSGISGALWFVLWMIVASDVPETNAFISERELEYIRQTRPPQRRNLSFRDIPLRRILTSKPVFAITVAHFAEMWGYYTMATLLPKYLFEILNFDQTNSGFITMFPFCVNFCFLVIGGQVVDYLRHRNKMSTNLIRKLCTCVACAAQCIFLVLTGISVNARNIIVYLSAGIGIGGLTYSGYYSNILDIAPGFSGFILGFANGIGSLSGIISPILTSAITSHETQQEWAVVFYIAAGLYLFALLVYAMFSTTELQPWANYQELS